MIRSKLLALAGLSAALSLVGCGGSGGGSTGSHTDMTAGQAEEVGSGIAGLINGAFAAASQFDITADGSLTDPNLAPGRTPSARDRLVARILTVGVHTAKAGGPVGPLLDGGILGGGGCAPTSSNSTDTDHDGIPDDNLLTFTTTNCHYTNEFGVTVLVHGTVEIKDQGTIWGFSLDFNALTYDLSGDNGSGTIIVSGLYTTTVGANLANSSEAVHLQINASNGQAVAATASWNLNFVPDTPLTGASTSLPAGSLTATGSWSYTRNSDAWSVILSTPEALEYDGSCATNPIFASGSLEGQIANARTHGFHIEFQGCGEDPVVTALGST